ncbi:unnamed protein product [Sympodiomycopsis kandeliae]
MRISIAVGNLRYTSHHSSRHGFHTSARLQQGTEISSASIAQAAEPLTDTAATAASSSSSGIYETIIHYFEPVVPYVHSLPEYFHVEGPHGYAISILLATFLIRSVITLPVHIMQRERTRRFQEIVKPEFDRLRGKDGLPKTMLDVARKSRKTHDEYKKMVETELRSRYRSLVQENKCHPIQTIAVPLVITIPLFIFLSFSIRAGVVQPSPFWSEILPWWSPSEDLVASFKTSAQMLIDRGMDPADLKHLSEPMGPSLGSSDSTFIGPLGLLVLNWGNVELTQYLRRNNLSLSSSEQSETDKEIAAQQKEQSHGKIDQAKDVETSDSVRSRFVSWLMRSWTILLVPISANVPGALLIYWTSTAAFTFAQNIIFSIVDRRRKVAKTAAAEAAAAQKAYVEKPMILPRSSSIPPRPKPTRR